MDNIFHAVILGIIQGLTEFLPISSSGHLVLAPYVLGWADPGLSFDVVLHFGTFLAVMAYFWKDLVGIISSIPTLLARRRVELRRTSKCQISNIEKSADGKYPSNMLWLMALGTIPGALAGYFFNDYAETIFRHPLLIAGTLALFGFLLYWSDKRSKKCRNVNEIGKADAVLIGLAQAIAIVPGVSRSGVTITAGLVRGLDRKSAARFSFLLSVPIIFGATLFKAKALLVSTIGAGEIVGIIAAAISGYLAIAGLIKFVEKASYQIFFWYRLVLAILIFMVWFWK